MNLPVGFSPRSRLPGENPTGRINRGQQLGALPIDRPDQSGAPPSDRRQQFCNRLNASKETRGDFDNMAIKAVDQLFEKAKQAMLAKIHVHEEEADLRGELMWFASDVV